MSAQTGPNKYQSSAADYFRQQDKQAAQQERDTLRQGYAQAQQGGYTDAWLQRNAPQLSQHDAYVGRQQGGQQYASAGGAQPSNRGLGTGGGVVGTTNYAAIAAYQNAPPHIRAQMDRMGMTPQYGGVRVGSSQNQAMVGMPNYVTGDPRMQNPAWIAQQRAQGAFGGNAGGGRPATPGQMGVAGFGARGGPAPQFDYSQAAAHRASLGGGVSGGPGVGSYGGAGGGAPYGMDPTTGAALASRVSGAIGQGLQGGGLDVGGMHSRLVESIGQDTARRRQQIREDFARRGQSGTEAEMAALRDLEESAQGASRQALRDLMVQNQERMLDERYRYAGLGANFLRGERSDLRAAREQQSQDLDRYLRMYAGV